MILLRESSLRTKIVLIGVCLPALLVAGLFYAYAWNAHESAVNAYVEKSRSVCLAVESTRSNGDGITMG